MNFQFAIYCNSSKSKGFGNLRRCLVLYDSLKEKNNHILFLIDDDITSKEILTKKNIHFEKISRSTVYQESKQILKILKKYNISKILLDAREKGEYLSKKFYLKQLKVISIDDAWIKNVYSDTIINVTGIKQYTKYKIQNKSAKLYFGENYFITDENFYKNKKLINSVRQKNFFNVTITMGGSDPTNLTYWILKILLENTKINLSIILGPFYNKSKLFKKMIALHDNCKIINSPTKIWNIFKNSDLVITSAGSTLFELSIQGIPCISIIAIKHQKLYAEYFHKKGVTINLGFKSKISKSKINNTISQLLCNDKKRKSMCKLGPKIVDGKGTQRVCKILYDEFNL
jgi:spore coat polysaccharide biosynthesis predicted glycosyltransferase SpsG